MSLNFCTNCGHQLKDGDKTCPNCGAVILNDDLSIDEQLDILKNDDITNDIKVKDDRTTEVVDDIKIVDDRVEDKTVVKITDDRTTEVIDEKVTDDRTTEVIDEKVTDDRKVEEVTPIKVKDDRVNEKAEEKTTSTTTDETKEDNTKNDGDDNKKDEEVKSKEGWLTRTLKIVLGILSFLILFACTFGAFALKPKADIDTPNYIGYVYNYLKLLDGASLTITVLGELLFNLVIPFILIVILFIKQFIVSIKIFKVGRNSNRGELWNVMIDNLVCIFVVKLASSIICKPCTSFNPLDLLMLPACINLIFYVFLYFFKLFRNEIGTFRFGTAKSGKLVAHRVIQTVAVCLMVVLSVISVNLLLNDVVYSFKPLQGIRSFVSGTMSSYITSDGIVPNNKIIFLFESVFDFGIDLLLMMFEVTIIVYIFNTIYRFVLRDVEEEYFNDCFYKNFSKKVFTCLVTLIVLYVCKFICVFFYLSSTDGIINTMSFSTCVSYILPYLIGLGFMIVLSIINSIISTKWLKQVRE